MTENFNILKVSGQVKTDVANIISGGKVKDAADTKEEFAKLGDLLSGVTNSDDAGYIESKRTEYTVKYKLQDLRNRATDYVKQMVDNAKAAFKPKKELDSDEADTLIAELKKAVAENRPNDVEYIREVLHQAGFDDKLKEFDEEVEKANEKMHGENVNKEEEPSEGKTTEANTQDPNTTAPNTTAPNTTEPNKAEPNKTEPSAQKDKVNDKSDAEKSSEAPKPKAKAKKKELPPLKEIPVPPGLIKPEEKKIIPNPWKSIFEQ